MTSIFQETINKIRELMPAKIAEELVSVQPIDGKPYKEFYDFLAANPDKSYVLISSKQSD